MLMAWRSTSCITTSFGYHTTLRCTPAMAAGVTTKLWEMADMVKVLEDWEVRQ